MSRDLHRLTVVQPTEGDTILAVSQVPRIGETNFFDLACGACDRVLVPNASLLDADSIDGRGRRVLVRCSNEKCEAINQLTDGRGNIKGR